MNHNFPVISVIALEWLLDPLNHRLCTNSTDLSWVKGALWTLITVGRSWDLEAEAWTPTILTRKTSNRQKPSRFQSQTLSTDEGVQWSPRTVSEQQGTRSRSSSGGTISGPQGGSVQLHLHTQDAGVTGAVTCPAAQPQNLRETEVAQRSHPAQLNKA